MMQIFFDENKQNLQVNSDLSFDRVVNLRQRALSLMMANKGQDIQISLADVEKIDSSGLALLVAWKRDAQKMGKAVVYQSIPLPLRHMAQVCGVERILF